MQLFLKNKKMQIRLLWQNNSSIVLNLAASILKALGWSLEVTVPNHPKCVICIAPHTSNWDFIYCELACHSLNWTASFLMKETWFFFPLNYFFKAIGGIPVPRKAKGADLTETIIRRFKESNSLKIAITPEGTRKRVDKWRSGMLYIAHGANVPILLAKLDYKHKHISLTDTYLPTGDIDTDIQFIKNYYKGVNAKYPEKFCTD